MTSDGETVMHFEQELEEIEAWLQAARATLAAAEPQPSEIAELLTYLEEQFDLCRSGWEQAREERQEEAGIPTTSFAETFQAFMAVFEKEKAVIEDHLSPEASEATLTN